MPTRFKFRKNLPELPKGAERAIVEQFQAVEAAINAVQGPQQRNATAVLNVAQYAAHAGELVLLEGNANGTLVTIPQGSSQNIEQSIRIALVGGVLTPGVSIGILGRKGTINGADTLAMTARGIVTLTSVGERGWVAIDAGGGGGGGLPPDGDYGDITVSGAGTVWSIDPGVVGNTELATMAANTVKANATAGVASPTDFGVNVNNFLMRLAGNIISGTGTQATTLIDVFTSVLKGLAPASGGGTTNFLRADGTWAAPGGGGGGLTLSTVEVDLGAGGVSGSFTIAGAGLTPGRPVLCVQAVGPYTGKGALEDVAEEPVWCTAVVTSAVLITVYWQSSRPVGGNVKFNYAVG